MIGTRRALALTMMVGTVLTGCRGAPPAPADAFRAGDHPPDFALTWRTPRSAETTADARWYIVDATGRLRLTRGPGDRWEGLPPTLIRLRDDERADLWGAVVDSGLLDPAPSNPPPDAHHVELIANGGTYRRAVSPFADAALTPLRMLDDLVAAHAARP